MWIINDWHAVFESSESRRLKKLNWVSMPNTHSGRGYRRLIKRPGGVEAFACFVLMVHVGSRMIQRGVLNGPEGPLTALDLEDLTMVPKETFEAAFDLLSCPEVMWITWVDGPAEVPAEFFNFERTALTTRAAGLTSRTASRAASIPGKSGTNGNLPIPTEKQGKFTTGIESVRKSPEKQAKSADIFGTGQDSTGQDRKASVVDSPLPVENMPDSARSLWSEPEPESGPDAETEAGFPPTAEVDTSRLSKAEIIRVQKAMKLYAEHLTRVTWKPPDWRIARDAARLAQGRYAELEEHLRASALAKRPIGQSTPVEMRTYGLVITLLQAHFHGGTIQ